jgi:hypothetical protein
VAFDLGGQLLHWVVEKCIPQGLKPTSFFGALAARLKPCPFKTVLQRVFFTTRKAVPFQNSFATNVFHHS